MTATSFTISTVNSVYAAQTVVTHIGSAADALAFGIRGAVIIAADELEHGASACAIVVSVQDENQTELLRSAVSLSVSPLLPRKKFVSELQDL